MTSPSRPAPAPRRRGGNMSSLHSGLVASVQEYLRWRGAYVIKILGSLGQRPGLPDVIAAFPPSGPQQLAGHLLAAFVAVECKTGKATMQPAQQREREELEYAGALYVLCHDLEGLEEELVQAGLVTNRALWTRREVSDA